jgi:hypothetical protein
MSEASVEPLRAPKRERISQREDESRGDGAALGLIVALALCVAGAIAYVHRHPVAEPGMVAADGSTIVAGSGGTGFIAGTSGERKVMAEQPLEKAKAIPTERFAGPVAHVTESDACKSLRLARDRIRDNMRKPHSEWEAADLQREMHRVTDQGTERGCWTGGA